MSCTRYISFTQIHLSPFIFIIIITTNERRIAKKQKMILDRKKKLRNTKDTRQWRRQQRLRGRHCLLAIFSVVTILKKNPTIWSSHVFSGTFMIFNIAYIYMYVYIYIYTNRSVCVDDDDLKDENNIYNIHTVVVYGNLIAWDYSFWKCHYYACDMHTSFIRFLIKL